MADDILDDEFEAVDGEGRVYLTHCPAVGGNAYTLHVESGDAHVLMTLAAGDEKSREIFAELRRRVAYIEGRTHDQRSGG